MNTTKTALITGGSRGLGRNMAIAIAKKGIDVVITYNSNKKAAEEVVNEIEGMGRKAKAFQLDTEAFSTFDPFFKEFTDYLEATTGSKRFDYLVNNAGVA